MADLLQGFSASFALAAFYLGVLSLLLRRERAELLKRVALVDTFWLAAMTAVSLHYFFAPHVVSCGRVVDLWAGLAKAARRREQLSDMVAAAES